MPDPVPTRAHLGRAVRRARLAHDKMTIEDLADLAGMHHTYLSGIERGRRNPSWQKLINIATTLEIPLSSIILDSENEAKLGHAPPDPAPTQIEN